MGIFDSFSPVYNFGKKVYDAAKSLGIDMGESYTLTKEDYKKLSQYFKGKSSFDSVNKQILESIENDYQLGLAREDMGYSFESNNVQDLVRLAHIGSLINTGISPLDRSEKQKNNEDKILYKIFGY